jgi:hypothetical protein
MKKIEYILNKKLEPLRVPSGWTIGKNNLFNIDIDWLNNLDNDLRFQVENSFIYDDVFYAKCEIDNAIAIVYIYVIKDYLGEKLNNLDYELEVLIYRRKKQELLFEFKSEPLTLLDICRKFEAIALNIYLNFNEEIDNSIFSNIINS